MSNDLEVLKINLERDLKDVWYMNLIKVVNPVESKIHVHKWIIRRHINTSELIKKKIGTFWGIRIDIEEI